MGQKEIQINKKYNFPKHSVVEYKEKILVISLEGCNWLVLLAEEYSIFRKLLDGATIEEVLNQENEENVISLLEQIEGKNFEKARDDMINEKNLFIYLTNRCNLRCNHCYMYSGEYNIDEMCIDSWKNVIKQFSDNGGEYVTFSGGEILLYQGFNELIDYTNRLGLKITLLTNGLLWNDDQIIYISSRISEVQISLDGYDESSYKKVRNIYGFEKSLDTIKKFSEQGTRVSVAVTPLYEGLEDFIDGFTKFAKQFSEDYPEIFIKINLELIKGRNIEVNDNENSKYKEKLKAMIENIYPDYYLNSFAISYKDGKMLNNCGYGGITIAANGDVFWCNRITAMNSKFNILNNEFTDIIEQSEIAKELTNVDNVLPCKNCEIRYICGGGCRLKYTNIEKVGDDNNKLITKCEESYKVAFYEKMILANDYFYSD